MTSVPLTYPPALLAGTGIVNKSASWRDAITPFFLPEAASVGRTFYHIAGYGSVDDTFVQFKSDQDNNYICGNERYRVLTYTSGGGTETYTLTLEVTPSSIAWTEDLVIVDNPTFPPPSGTTTISRTATREDIKKNFSNPPVHWITELSEQVTRAYLSTHLGTLIGSSPRAITFNSSSFSHASSTESSNGGNLIQGAYGFRGLGPRFLDSWAFGIEGSLEDFWQNNIIADVQLEVRANEPRIIPVGEPPSSNPVTLGSDAVKARGFWQTELSDPTENFWRCGSFGSYFEIEWPYHESADPREILDQIPLTSPPIGDPVYCYSSSASTSSIYVSGITLVSRTARRYKIGIETSEDTYDEETGELIATIITPLYEVETDPDTLRVRIDSFENTYLTPRIGDVSVWEGTPENGAWRIIASNRFHVYWTAFQEWQWAGEIEGEEPEKPEGLVPLTATVLGNSISTPGIHLLVAAQSLSGSQFGFTPLDGSSGTRYRTKLVTKESSTAPSGTVPAIVCDGAAWPSGSLSIQVRETYFNGELTSPEILAANQELDGNPFGTLTASAASQNGSLVTLTATLHRREWTAAAVNGAYAVRLDIPSRTGTLLSREVVSHIPTYLPSITQHGAPWVWRQVDPGTTLFASGQRLRPKAV